MQNISLWRRLGIALRFVCGVTTKRDAQAVYPQMESISGWYALEVLDLDFLVESYMEDWTVEAHPGDFKDPAEAHDFAVEVFRAALVTASDEYDNDYPVSEHVGDEAFKRAQTSLEAAGVYLTQG